MSRYRYYLAIQTTLPESFQEDAEFNADLELLSELGFDGVELNIREPEGVDPGALSRLLGRHGLSFSMFATGLTAKSHGLSLASTDEILRNESVRRAKEFLTFAGELGGGIIVGFLKGAAGEDTPAHLEQLKRSVAELAPEAEQRRVPLLVEAINRFESPLGHSLADTYDIIRGAINPYLQILPDTWHMNIEESNMDAALVQFKDRYSSLHLSENNRLFPGMGSIDFKRIIGLLDALGYRGKLAIEGNLTGTFRESVRQTMEHLTPILR